MKKCEITEKSPIDPPSSAVCKVEDKHAVMKIMGGDGTRTLTLIEPMLGPLAKALAQALAKAGALVGGGTRTLTVVVAKFGALVNQEDLAAALTEVGVLALSKNDTPIEMSATEREVKVSLLSSGGFMAEGGTAVPGLKRLFLPKGETTTVATLALAGTLAGTGILPKIAAKGLALELATVATASLADSMTRYKKEEIENGAFLTLVAAGIVDGAEIEPGILATASIARHAAGAVLTSTNAEHIMESVKQGLKEDYVKTALFKTLARSPAGIAAMLANDIEEAEEAAFEAMFLQKNTKRWYH